MCECVWRPKDDLTCFSAVLLRQDLLLRLFWLANELQDLPVSPSPGLEILIITTSLFMWGPNSGLPVSKTIYQQGHLPRPLNFFIFKSLTIVCTQSNEIKFAAPNQ